jgi:hypothetical protein
VEEAEEVDRPGVGTCCNAAEVFEFVEAPFNRVSLFVGLGVVGDEGLACRIARNDGFGVHAGDQTGKSVGIIGFVGTHTAWRKAFEQVGSERSVAALARREDQLQRAAKRVGGHMDLCCQSSSGTPQSLIPPFWPPPLPVAAC